MAHNPDRDKEQSKPKGTSEQLSRWLIVAFVALIPFRFPLGSAFLNLELSDLAALGFLALWILSNPERKNMRWGPIHTGALLYLGLLLPSFLNTPSAVSSFVEFLKAAYGVVLALILASWATKPDRWNLVAKTYALAAGAVTLISCILWLLGTLGSQEPSLGTVRTTLPNMGQVVRVKATMLTPSMLALYLTLCVPFLAEWAAARSPWPTSTRWSTGCLGLLAAAATAASAVAGYLAAFALFPPAKKRVEHLARWLIALLAIAAIGFGMVSTTVSFHEIQLERQDRPQTEWNRPFEDFAGPSGGGAQLHAQVSYAWVLHGILKRLAIEEWQKHPWVGIGLKQFPDRVGEAHKQGRIQSAMADPHSTWLGSLAETGLIGFIGLITFWGIFLRYAFRSSQRMKRDWRVWALLSGLLGLLINSVHADIMHFRYLWVGVALILAAERAHAHQKPGKSISVGTTSKRAGSG